MIGCGNFSLVGTAGKTCGVYPLRCKRWGCPTCGPRKVRATIARINAGMALGTVRFFTITSPGGEDAATTYARFPERWKRLHQRLVRRFGRIEYLGVVEPQPRRGAAHVHVVYRGPFIPQRWLSRAAAESGFGRIVDIRRSHKGLAGYVAKYLTKELAGSKAGPPRYFRRVRWSKGWCVWERRRRVLPWTRWWIADAVPRHAAMSATGRGYRVVEVVADDPRARFEPRRVVQWLRDLRARRHHSSLEAYRRPESGRNRLDHG